MLKSIMCSSSDFIHDMLQGLSQVIVVIAAGKQLLFRQYAIAFKKSGAQVPRTELAEIGPRFDFSIRRSRAAPDEIQTQSMKQPKVEKKKVGPQFFPHQWCMPLSTVAACMVMLAELCGGAVGSQSCMLIRRRCFCAHLGCFLAAAFCKGSIDSGLCQLQEKNVGYDSLEGKVGRIYLPKQDLNSMALNKMKVLLL